MENKGGFKGFGMGMMKDMMQGMGGIAHDGEVHADGPADGRGRH